MRSESELASLTSRFARFAREARDRSPLYEHLALAIADDADLASVLDDASERQRRANLLFAAVHDLILAGTVHPLAAYYPSVGGERRPDELTVPTFRDFLAAFEDQVARRIRTRATQTNEPGRCAAIRPALAQVAARSDRPVALVELGSSAGLLLHLDRYHYRYGDLEAGPATAAVTIAPDLRGPPPTELELPQIVTRIGIDLDPLSPSDPDDARWLRACVWPEDVERLRGLDRALSIARRYDDVEHVEADLLSALVPIVRLVDEELLVVVMHSTSLAYVDEAGRAAIDEDLDGLGAERDLARICFEGPFVEPFATMEDRSGLEAPGEAGCLLGLTLWLDGRRSDALLARSQPHGAWLEWMSKNGGDL